MPYAVFALCSFPFPFVNIANDIFSHLSPKYTPLTPANAPKTNSH